MFEHLLTRTFQYSLHQDWLWVRRDCFITVVHTINVF